MRRKNNDGKITVAVVVFLSMTIMLGIILALIGAAIFGLVYVTDAFGIPRWSVPVGVAAVSLLVALSATRREDKDPDAEFVEE